MVALTARLLRDPLPAGFERWHLVVAEGDELETRASEWAGAIVAVERGTLIVGCIDGGQRTFVAGDLLALGWLPLKWMRSIGPGDVSLTAVRRRGNSPSRRFVRVRPGSPVDLING
jgi:hypothetical protein